MKFYLGTHAPNWLDLVNIPWFVSVARLVKRKSRLPLADWIMDSGGFTQIANHGDYQISADEYLSIIYTQAPRAAFCQDWMVETFILKKTGLSIRDHQERTLESYLYLNKQGRGLPIRPVLQGWTAAEYVDHVKMYRAAGVDMGQLFGVGSVCSRNGNTLEIQWILRAIRDEAPGIQLHGFGLKTEALTNGHIVENLASADSMAWSSRGRREKLCGAGWCNVKSCANCMEYALLWRKRVLAMVNRTSKQAYLPLGGAA